jgi:hypothetical protein
MNSKKPVPKNKPKPTKSAKNVKQSLKARANKTDTNKKVMLEALESSLGVVTTACRKTGLSRAQHYDWLKKDAKYAAFVTDLKEVAIDFAESKLHGLINNNDTAATIFYLKTQGKRRGYIEKQEIDFTEKTIIVETPHEE